MAWKDEIDITKYHIAAAPYGGPIGTICSSAYSRFNLRLRKLIRKENEPLRRLYNVMRNRVRAHVKRKLAQAGIIYSSWWLHFLENIMGAFSNCMKEVFLKSLLWDWIHFSLSAFFSFTPLDRGPSYAKISWHPFGE